MHLRINVILSLILLTIVDLCLSVPNLADQTINTNNGISIFHNNNSKFTAHSKHFVIDASDEVKNSDNSELNTFHRNNDERSASAAAPAPAPAPQAKSSFNDYQSNADDIDHSNFLITNYLSDGEIERRIHFNGITAKETLVSNSGRFLSLWQLSYRDTFIQMIHSNNGEILDCDLLTGWNFNEEFVQKFYDEIHRMQMVNGVTGFYSKYQMPTFRHHMRHNIPEIDKTMDSDNEINGATNVTYYPLYSNQDIPKDLIGLMDFAVVKMECDAYHQKVMRIAGDLNSERDDITQNATEHLNRKKRAISDWLIAPNTKWCGRGQTADKYSQLGGASKADKCCRRHDHCKFNIYAMTTKWRLFNYRPFTISHCSCDMRFRTCLKMADSSDATMVGKLFFNIVQTKCFVLKPEKYCKKHSWWGTCESEGVRKRAYLRDNKKF